MTIPTKKIKTAIQNIKNNLAKTLDIDELVTDIKHIQYEKGSENLSTILSKYDASTRSEIKVLINLINPNTSRWSFEYLIKSFVDDFIGVDENLGWLDHTDASIPFQLKTLALEVLGDCD